MSKMGEVDLVNKSANLNDAKNTNKQVINLFAPDTLTTNSNESDKQSVELSKNSDIVINRLSLVNPDSNGLELIAKYITNKIEKGHGEMIFSLGASEGQEMGLTPKDMESSMNTLLSLEKLLNLSITLLRERTVEPLKNETNNTTGNNNTETSCESLLVRECLLRKNFENDDFMEVRVAVVGNVDSGKSTLLGVLTHCVLDDGRGDARTKLFRHKHEIESGRTSSVGNDILGFDSKGDIMNEKDAHGAKSLDWEAICKTSSKVITFIDLAGHEKYLKTTVFGMTGHAPDFCMLMVGANMGVVGMTKEHLGLALALNVPVFVVITKIDMCPPNVKEETLKILQKILKSPGCRKIAYLVENQADVVTCAINFTSERLCPIFQVSNVTGQNLDLLRMFLNLLNPRMETHSNEPAEFQIDDIYSVPGVGTVVSGTCYRGVISLNDNLLLGPDLIGGFRNVTIKGIHRKRMPVKECRGGQTASFALKKIKRSELRKGMVLISEKLNPIASWEFEAEILVLHHPTTISVNYQAMVHCGSIRQTATILDMSVEHMRTGDKATVKFSFIKNPEYLKVGNKMIFREGRTKAIGTITKVNLPPTASRS